MPTVRLEEGFVSGLETPDEKKVKFENTVRAWTAQDPQINETFYHYCPRLAAEGIAKSGFRTSNIGMAGGGVYVTSQSPVAHSTTPWPKAGWRERILAENYGEDAKRQARQNCADVVIVLSMHPLTVNKNVPERPEAVHVSPDTPGINSKRGADGHLYMLRQNIRGMILLRKEEEGEEEEEEEDEAEATAVETRV